MCDCRNDPIHRIAHAGGNLADRASKGGGSSSLGSSYSSFREDGRRREGTPLLVRGKSGGLHRRLRTRPPASCSQSVATLAWWRMRN